MAKAQALMATGTLTPARNDAGKADVDADPADPNPDAEKTDDNGAGSTGEPEDTSKPVKKASPMSAVPHIVCDEQSLNLAIALASVGPGAKQRMTVALCRWRCSGSGEYGLERQEGMGLYAAFSTWARGPLEHNVGHGGYSGTVNALNLLREQGGASSAGAISVVSSVEGVEEEKGQAEDEVDGEVMEGEGMAGMEGMEADGRREKTMKA